MPKLSKPVWLLILVICLILPGVLCALSVLLPGRPDGCVGLACLSFPVGALLGIVAGLKISEPA
jgi:hypothetical protein